MEWELAEKLNAHSILYVPLDNEQSLEKIWRLFLQAEKSEPETPLEYVYFGMWAETKGDLAEMVRYFEEGAKQGSVHCIYSLGVHYERMIKDYTSAVTYYQRAGEMGCFEAYYHWADICQKTTQFQQMVACYVRCIQLAKQAPTFDSNRIVGDLIDRSSDSCNKYYQAARHRLTEYCVRWISKENLELAIEYRLRDAIQSYLYLTKYRSWIPRQYLPDHMQKQRDAALTRLYHRQTDPARGLTYFQLIVPDLRRLIFEYLFEQAYRPYRSYRS